MSVKKYLPLPSEIAVTPPIVPVTGGQPLIPMDTGCSAFDYGPSGPWTVGGLNGFGILALFVYSDTSAATNFANPPSCTWGTFPLGYIGGRCLNDDPTNGFVQIFGGRINGTLSHIGGTAPSSWTTANYQKVAIAYSNAPQFPTLVTAAGYGTTAGLTLEPEKMTFGMVATNGSKFDPATFTLDNPYPPSVPRPGNADWHCGFAPLQYCDGRGWIELSDPVADAGFWGHAVWGRTPDDAPAVTADGSVRATINEAAPWAAFGMVLET